MQYSCRLLGSSVNFLGPSGWLIAPNRYDCTRAADPWAFVRWWADRVAGHLTLGSRLSNLMHMPEIWLKPNRRVLVLAMVPIVTIGAIGAALLRRVGSVPLGWPAIIVIIVTVVLLLGLLRQLLTPRVAYRDGSVLFYLRAGGPIAVPLAFVEAFFQGQSAAHLPGESRHQAKSINLIARLSQRESEWQQRDVKAALGRWEEGYVTIRGTWCEPITEDTIRQLNRRLGEVKREEKAKSEGVASK